MPRCFVCNKDFADLVTYHSHLNDDHRAKDSFSCAESNCRRTYNSFNSLKKHLPTVHDIALTKLPEPKLQQLQPGPNVPLEESIPSYEDHIKVANEESVQAKIYGILFTFCANLYAKNIPRCIVGIVMIMMQRIIDEILKVVKNNMEKNA